MNRINYKILGLILIIVFPFSMFVISLYEQGVIYPNIITLRRSEIMIRTIVFGIIVSIIVVVIAWGLAYSLAIAFKDKYKVILIILTFMMLPPFIHSYLWLNTMYKLFGLSALSGMFISIIVQSIYLIPLATLLWYVFFVQISGEYFYVTKLNHDNKYNKIMTLFTMSKGVYLIVFGLVFVLAITDFTIPSIFAYNTFPIEVMALFSSQSYLAPPLMISIVMILLTISVFYLISKHIHMNLVLSKVIDIDNKLFEKKSPIKYYLAILLCLTLVPFGLMIEDVISRSNILSILIQYKDDYFFAFMTSVLGSLIILVVSYYMNYYLIIKSSLSKIVTIILIIMFSVPNTILGLLVNGYYNKLIELIPILDSLYYSMIPSIHLYVIKFLPIGFWIIALGFNMIPSERISQARLDSNHMIHIFRTSMFYSLKEYLIVGFFVNMILIIGELGGSIMVVPPGKSTITITIYNYLHYGSTDVVSILSLGVTLSIFMLIFCMTQMIKILVKKYEDREKI